MIPTRLRIFYECHLQDHVGDITTIAAVLALMPAMASNGNALVWLVFFAFFWLAFMAWAAVHEFRTLRARRRLAERRRDPGLRVYWDS